MSKIRIGIGGPRSPSAAWPGTHATAILGELWAPLTTIVAALERLDLATTPPRRAAALLAQATAAARQLRSLAAAARDDRPQQQGRRGVCRAPHRLRDLLQELQQTLDLHVRRHGAALHVGLPAEELQVDTDPGPLLQILCDLVDDALESPRASRHIDMRCRTVGNMAIVFVGNDRPPDAANDPSPSPASRQISGRSRHRCPRHDRTVDRSGALATELLATALGGHLGRLRRGPFATVSWLAVPLAIGKPGGPAA